MVGLESGGAKDHVDFRAILVRHLTRSPPCGSFRVAETSRPFAVETVKRREQEFTSSSQKTPINRGRLSSLCRSLMWLLLRSRDAGALVFYERLRVTEGLWPTTSTPSDGLNCSMTHAEIDFGMNTNWRARSFRAFTGFIAIRSLLRDFAFSARDTNLLAFPKASCKPLQVGTREPDVRLPHKYLQISKLLCLVV